MDKRVDPEARRARLGALESGQVQRGTVTAVGTYGAFVDLGGIYGLISVVNLAWRHFASPAEIVEVGQELAVMVLDVDLDRERVSLSLKELQPQPLLEFARTKLDCIVQGRVSKVVPFGVFVRVDDGVEGLIPEAEFTNRGIISLPSLGSEIAVKVTDINIIRSRIRLVLP
ncbi:S1 RNA-binding domain-containing protein [Nonomuraea soli]|uniref:Small subunit ribosomal protein S1 n=1 Tax=Nonomuraea soli TaxID=1032476 RepID=A0A7W0CUW9_9ACTN|nr:S1 RNA-binding domain-containing protein [Nonomuraea soli]MBA2897793.1 small subunit ribosomal protein S1 [Nonomuraea soli]